MNIVFDEIERQLGSGYNFTREPFSEGLVISIRQPGKLRGLEYGHGRKCLTVLMKDGGIRLCWGGNYVRPKRSICWELSDPDFSVDKIVDCIRKLL